MAVPDWADLATDVAGIVGASFTVLAFVHEVRRKPRRSLWSRLNLRHRNRTLPDALRTLIDRQWDEARRHKYLFTVGTGVPPLPEIYVEQQADILPRTDSGRTQLTLAEMLRDNPSAVVIADPGVGKSTAIAKILWEQCGWLRTTRPRDHDSRPPYGPVIPIALPANLHGCRTLTEALVEEWRRATGTEPTPGQFDSAPSFGKSWLVLIDGIDQVLDTPTRQRVLELLGTAPSGQCRRVLITTRPLLGWELGYLKTSALFRLRKFDRPALEIFAERWVRFRTGTPVDSGVVDVGTFLAATRSGPIATLVRTPLIATITYLLLETSGQPPPASRGELYERYVLHLLRSRPTAPPPPAFLVHGIAGERAWSWCVDQVRDLLEGVADRVLVGSAPPLRDCAVNWLRSHAPAGTLDGITGWEDGLDGLLASTSLVVPDRGGLAFAHPSFAEYLAAGPRSGRRFDPEVWLADAQSPDSRSLALFELSRRCRTSDRLASDVVRLLLDRGGVDVGIAGEILADGIAVPAELRAQVIDQLFVLIAADDLDTGAALRALVMLAVDPKVRDLMATFAEDGAQPDWVRADVAEELCDLDSELGVRLLRAVAAGSDDAWLLGRTLRKLIDLGAVTDADRSVPGVEGAAVQSGVPSGGARAGEWLRQAARSAANPPAQRLSAALDLAERRDDGWQELVALLLVDSNVSVDNRFQATRRLAGDEEGLRLLRPIAARASLPYDIRVPVLSAMSGAQDEWARQVLNELLHNDGPRLRARFPQLDAWREEVGARSYNADPSLPPRSPYFAGREAILAAVADGLESGPVCLTGLPGIGKTAIAREYAHRFADLYDEIVWSRPGDPTPSGGRVLVVLDGYSSDRDPADLFDANADVLITTRETAPWQRDRATITVGAFTHDETLAFLRHRLPRGVSVADANRLSEDLAGLPLALMLATAHIADTGEPVDDYLKELHTDGGVNAIRRSLDSLRGNNLELLRLCAVFGAAPIPLAVFKPGAVPADSPLGAMLGDEIEFARAIRNLGRLALIQEGGNSVMVPEPVRSAVAATDLHWRHARLLLTAATPDPEAPEHWPLYEDLLPHLLDPVISRPDPQLMWKTARFLRRSGQPRQAARYAEAFISVPALKTEYADTLVELGRLNEAWAVSDRSWSRVGSASARASGDFAGALRRDRASRTTTSHDVNIGLDLILIGAFRVAHDTLRRAHQDYVDAEAVISALDVAPEVVRAQWLAGDRDRLIERAEVAANDCLTVLGRRHPGTLRARKIWAILTRGTSTGTQSIAHTTAGLADVYGPSHPETLAAGVAWANSLRAMGDRQSAHGGLTNLVARYRAELGANHPFTLMCEANLAIIEHELGQPEQARKINERCLDGLRDFPLIYRLTVATNLARDLYATGDRSAAVDLGRSTAAEWAGQLGDDHPFTRVCAGNLRLDVASADEPREFLDFDPPRI
jgi:hypothetical protein